MNDEEKSLLIVVGAALRDLGIAKQLHTVSQNVWVNVGGNLTDLANLIVDEADEGRLLTETMIDHRCGSNTNKSIGLRRQFRLAMMSNGTSIDDAKALLAIVVEWKEQCVKREACGDAIRNGDGRIAIDLLKDAGADEAEVRRVSANVVQQNAKRDYPPTDLGNAELFKDLYGSDYRYVCQWKSWIVWDG